MGSPEAAVRGRSALSGQAGTCNLEYRFLVHPHGPHLPADCSAV